MLYYLCRWVSVSHEEIRKNEDKSSNLLSEIIENIKVIKLNSWTQRFITLALNLRRKEYINKFIFRAMYIPQDIINVIVYWSMVIGMFMIVLHGTQIRITVSSAIMIFRVLGQIKFHSGYMPEYTRFLSEFMTSMNRIEKYLDCDEIEEELLKITNGGTNKDYSIIINKANYYWGFDEYSIGEFESKGTKQRQEKQMSEIGVSN